MKTNRTTIITKVVTLTLLFLVNFTTITAQSYPASFDIETLQGSNGFTIPGLSTASPQLGTETRFIGDINNDGFEDICLGNGNEPVGGFELAGRAYIIFGSATVFPTSFDLTSLDGTNGFVVESVAFDERRGSTVAGPGDINGDGIDDVIIGSSNSSADDIVIYGSSTFPAVITVNDIDGTNGFLLDTPGSNQVDGLGDVNGDGINDFIIGTPHWSGQSWIVFGRSSNFPAIVDVSWLDGINGFRTSSFGGSRPSYKVGGAGDINNDGFNDILIGNWASSFSAPNEISYALFGKNTPFDPIVDLIALDGSDGFRIDNQGNGFLTFVGSIGDVNGDGIDDCFSENNIILGSETPFPANLLMSDLDGSNGFVLENYVLCAAPTGDLNFDGIDDFIVAGADDYVVFGTTGGFPATFNSATLDGTNGFQIPIDGNSNIGRPIDGGRDFNGDGLSDFIFGDSSFGNTGQVQVVYGGDHYAIPLNNGYPQAIDETVSGFTLVVNGPETGTIHYVIYPGNSPSNVDYDDILNGTGAVINGNFDMNLQHTDVLEIISTLAGNTTYDVYLFLEDAFANQGEIYKLDNITTLGDTIAPTIICPSNQTVSCDTTLIPDYTGLVFVTDNQDPNPALSQNPVAGTTFINGMTITMIATDATGNTNSCTFIVNEAPDTEAPVMSCLSNQNESAGVDCQFIVPDYTVLVSASDNCGTVTITQTPLPGTIIGIGTTEISLNASDGTNDSAPCFFNLIVEDVLPPTIECVENQTEFANENCSFILPDYTGMALAMDNCNTITITQNPAAGTSVNTGDTTVTLTANDGTNMTSCNFVVTVVDEIPPIAQCQNICLQLNSDGFVVIEPSDIDNGSFDNCDIASIMLDNAFFNCENIGENEVTLTVTDTSGNSSECTAIVTIDTETICQNITVVLNENGIATITPDNIYDDTNSICTPANLSIDVDTFTCDQAGTIVPVVLTATANNGSTTSCIAQVTVVDNIPPAITCPSQTLIIAALEPYTLPDFVETGEVSISDNCEDQLEYTQNPEIGSIADAGEMNITVTATDTGGNETSCEFTIFVDPSLGVTEVNDLKTLRLYPNPANQFITLNNPNNLTLGKASLVDVTGRLIQTIDLSDMATEHRIDLSEIVSASYFLLVEGTDRIETFQIVKK